MNVHSFFILQAEQIVAKLMMNMAAVDRRLAEEASRQNLVSYRLNGVCKISKDLKVSEWPGIYGTVFIESSV